MHIIRTQLAALTLAASVAAGALALTSCASLQDKSTGTYGIVEVATAVPPIDMHRVVLQSIDGHGQASTGRVPPNISLMFVGPHFELRNAQSQFRLSPGEHKLEFTAIVNRRDAVTMLHPITPFSADGSGALKLYVEAGKRYYIAAHVNEGRPEQWEPVVYKTEVFKE